jgi:hypothetical protein
MDKEDKKVSDPKEGAKKLEAARWVFVKAPPPPPPPPPLVK